MASFTVNSYSMESTVIPSHANTHSLGEYVTSSEKGNNTIAFSEFELNDVLTKHWAYATGMAIKLYGPHFISTMGIALNIFAFHILGTSSLTSGVTPHLMALSVFDILTLLCT